MPFCMYWVLSLYDENGSLYDFMHIGGRCKTCSRGGKTSRARIFHTCGGVKNADEGKERGRYGVKHWDKVRLISRIHVQFKNFLQMGIG
eukprot:3223176-Pleurochrysis_carterae.AAC.1